MAYRDNTQLEGEVNVTKLPLFALGRGKQSRGERETMQRGGKLLNGNKCCETQLGAVLGSNPKSANFSIYISTISFSSSIACCKII